MDKYSIHARLYPIAISLLPLGVLHFAYFVEIHNHLKLFTSLVFYTALIYLLSQLGRDNGKRKEKALWNSWGGPPVEQLLSFENIEIDLHTKQRYHQKMLRLIPIEKDICVLKLTDEYLSTMYKSWSKYLITHTRDTKKFDLIYKELVNYGFRRNLWGLKSISISLLVLCIILNYLYNVYLFRFLNPVDFDFNFYITEVMLTTLLAFWTFIINRSWVKIPAFAYAKRLLESIDQLII